MEFIISLAILFGLGVLRSVFAREGERTPFQAAIESYRNTPTVSEFLTQKSPVCGHTEAESLLYSFPREERCEHCGAPIRE